MGFAAALLEAGLVSWKKAANKSIAAQSDVGGLITAMRCWRFRQGRKRSRSVWSALRAETKALRPPLAGAKTVEHGAGQLRHRTGKCAAVFGNSDARTKAYGIGSNTIFDPMP
jgi:hypothetical protein